jgi:hypothetical protein
MCQLFLLREKKNSSSFSEKNLFVDNLSAVKKLFFFSSKKKLEIENEKLGYLKNEKIKKCFLYFSNNPNTFSLFFFSFRKEKEFT